MFTSFRSRLPAVTVLGAVLALAASPAHAASFTKGDLAPKTVHLARGGITMGSGFTFDYDLSWDTAHENLKGKGEIRFLGKRILLSETDGHIVDGHTLELKRSWNGASGLRVEAVFHFRPERDGSIHWDADYKARNKYTSVGQMKGHKSGTIKPVQAPWLKPKPAVRR